ncbi:ATP-binding protein [Mesorhizobium sp. L2C067A000]|uniref:ATP-binding protein n=1 Tax=Mesorhizobium sp. L2C067A000 TaxID=1287106 RepID=UPI0018CB3965|nr:ATP-binding protein [Mesorhizobium sp. L2C067A000]
MTGAEGGIEETAEPRALHLHTLESLCADLINGNGVLVGDDTFEIPSADTKAILNWYRLNRSKWQGRMNESDAEAIAACVGEVPTPVPSGAFSIGNAKHRLRLVRARAHRFAGVHAYGTERNAPSDFAFEPSQSLTLLEGWNGSGKTSLLNSIIWCLTGKILRPQRPPESGIEEFESAIERVSESGVTTTAHSLTPITPLPTLSSFTPSSDQRIPVDTWVELTFADEEGTELPPVRRTQSRTSRGRVTEAEPDLASLGVDPVAFSISTTMPAMLQHIQLGQASDLGKAVSQLTGLADLILLERHAERAASYIKTRLRQRAEEAITQSDVRFNEAVGDLRSRVDEFPAMMPVADYPTPCASKEVEKTVANLLEHFNDKKSAALNAAKLILGDTFNSDDAKARADLEDNIEAARGELGHIGQLESAARLSALGKLSDADIKLAIGLVDRISSEAARLSALLADPGLAARKQLYASVASWAIALGISNDAQCHLCSRPLLDHVDPVTGKLLRVHMEEARQEEPELLSQTMKAWVMSRVAMLADQLPAALRDERDRDLPRSPVALLKSALCDELFATKSFVGTLSTLRAETVQNFDMQALALPEYIDPETWKLPASLADDAAALGTAVQRILRAVAFSSWRTAVREKLVALFASVIGKEAGDASDLSSTSASPLIAKLAALQGIVDGAVPIGDAIEYCTRMSSALVARRKSETVVENYDKAVSALAQLEKLGSLASTQVDSLQKNLEGRAARWRGGVYTAPGVSSPAIRRTVMSATGVLEFHAGTGKITAPAQHISNASALRAGLIGFFLAFREHVLSSRGGLELLLLDDPQELLDEHNRGRMADVIVALAAGTAQPIVTTYDRNFAMMVAAEAASKCAFNHRSIHGVNATRETIALGPAKRQLDEDRLEFEKNIDDHSAALRYAATTRTYIETRLRDLFDDPAYPAYTSATMKPSLGDFLNYLRSLVATPPSALFSHGSVVKFARHAGLASDSQCYAVLNDAHHAPGTISYGRVHAVANHFIGIAKGVEEVHRAFREWRSNNQLPQLVANDNGASLTPVAPSAHRFVIHPDLAAFAGPGTPEATQESATEQFSSQWFDDKALFYVRCDNFGFAIPKGYIAIVEATPGAGRDRNLVIALKKGETLARRIFLQGDSYALAAETPDPRQSPPTKVARGDDYALHRVVGCLLVESVPPASSREAIQMNRDKIVDEIRAVYRLDKESAVPLALPRQLLLGGRYLSPAEIGQHEGKLAAITLKDGTELLKRIGAPVSSMFPYIRHFETVGGLGQSIVLQTEEVEGSVIDAQVIDHARLAVGVIYED